MIKDQVRQIVFIKEFRPGGIVTRLRGAFGPADKNR